MASFGDALRGFGSVLNPQVAQAEEADYGRRQAQAGQLQQLLLQHQLQQQNPENLARLQALKNDQGYRQELSALGDNPDLSKVAQIATKYGKPEVAASLFKAQEDRAARVQAAQDNLELRKQQSEFLHEQRMSRLQSDTERQAETSRHNQVMEGLNTQLAQVRAAMGPQPHMVTTPEGVFQVDRSGKATPVVGPDGPLSGKPTEKALPTSAAQKLFENQQNLRRAETALALVEGKKVGSMEGDADATGWKGFLPDAALQRFDPKGTDTRAALADLGSLVIHERSGAAVTAAEFPRLQPFIPKINDDPETVKKKLKRFAQIYRDISTETANFYRESGYKVPDLLPGVGAGAGAAGGVEFEGYSFPNQEALDKYKKAKGI